MVVNNSEMSREIEIYRMLDRTKVFATGARNVLSTMDKLVNREKIVQEIISIKLALDEVDKEIARIDGQSTTLA